MQAREGAPASFCLWSAACAKKLRCPQPATAGKDRADIPLDVNVGAADSGASLPAAGVFFPTSVQA